MNPWVLLDEVEVPGDGGAMKLYQRAFEFSISVKNDELMNSRMHHSEEELAAALAALGDSAQVVVLSLRGTPGSPNARR